MPWQQKISYLIGQPVGLSLTNDKGRQMFCVILQVKSFLLLDICIKPNSPSNNTIFI
ncbi:hypothetical protein ACIQY5_17695 [Peribacillus frigoritolerans]|uniref:hypothetical protein n=1 Tax=Peribacillus frigoritolerans TaxID=450367 RepID=UPI003806DD4A